jgi:hypothetical protein
MSDTPKTDAFFEDYDGNLKDLSRFARELERDNAALREDKERMDWLEETLISVYAIPTPDMSGARIRGQLRNKRRDDSGAAGPSYIRVFHASIRAAIDAAKEAKP